MSDMFSLLLLTTFSLPCPLYRKDSFKILSVCDLKAYLVTCPDRRENSSIFWCHQLHWQSKDRWKWGSIYWQRLCFVPQNDDIRHPGGYSQKGTPPWALDFPCIRNRGVWTELIWESANGVHFGLLHWVHKVFSHTCWSSEWLLTSQSLSRVICNLP